MPFATFFRVSFVLAGALVVTGCATPLQQCLSSAYSEVRFLEEELTERRVNIARGYAIHRETQVEMMPDFCWSRAYRRSFMCMEPVPMTRESRRPINEADERERIAQLERALARERATAAQVDARCHAQFPEG